MDIIKFKIFNDQDGNLLPVDHFHLPFEPKRTFIVTGVPKGEQRGEHAHRICKQFLICVQGEIEVKLDFGGGYIETKTFYPGEGVLIENYVWDTQLFKTGNDILLVFASEYYDKEDYIEDYAYFSNNVWD